MSLSGDVCLPHNMKWFLVILLVTLLGVTFVSGLDEPWCRCGLFVSSRYSEIMVYEMPEIPIVSCTEHDICRGMCRNELCEYTDDLNLWAMVGNETVGQYVCTGLYGNYYYFIHNRYVHAYYELCGGPWEYADLTSQQMLCCNRGEHEHCISK
ncbi:uncharacterized protein [Panulirus ornatus]|uniref:uncharacterized protein n=1 Tax=Panulirus ornatus TaxID=150431 RepID=UPI003A89BC4F